MRVHLTVPRFATYVKENRRYILMQANDDYYRSVLFEVMVSDPSYVSVVSDKVEA